LAKNLKLHVKNTQLAEAINLKGLKAKLSKKKGQEESLVTPSEEGLSEVEIVQVALPVEVEIALPVEVVAEPVEVIAPKQPEVTAKEVPEEKASLVLGPIFTEEPSIAIVPHKEEEPKAVVVEKAAPKKFVPPKPERAAPPAHPPVHAQAPRPVPAPAPKAPPISAPGPKEGILLRKDALPTLQKKRVEAGPRLFVSSLRSTPEKLGPVLDKELPKKPPRKEPVEVKTAPRSDRPPYDKNRPQQSTQEPFRQGFQKKTTEEADKAKQPPRDVLSGKHEDDKPLRRIESGEARKPKPKIDESKNKSFKKGDSTSFDTRHRHGLAIEDDEDKMWKKRRAKGSKFSQMQVPEIVRPTKISVRLPISVKDLAVEMKLKASELISKLFMQGVIVTLNDILDDELVVQLLGQELGCEISIDTREEERIRITGKTIAEEIKEEREEDLVPRSPVVTFMGHVDHGKTSLIDAIRKTNRAQYEVGAITQHIGAFTCLTDKGPITIIDTPGHEAFSAMRMRGAAVTDIVVLVIAGDEGVQVQTIEALKEAKESGATIVVAVNKSDKPAFDLDQVYRQLADHELLPEVWGGTTVTVPCSALTKKGIPELLEMIALQAEILELKANPKARARGTVIESEMSKGVGALATILVQNGTLKAGDSIVFGTTWARVKSMRDENNKDVAIAGPSTPVRVTGLSGVPTAGEEFIVVKDEREARDIAEARREGQRQLGFQTKRKISLENMMEKASTTGVKKVLTLILRADVQGSLEAVKNALMKIESNKVELNIISSSVGEISESDLQLASASKAMILGFHTGIESHADPMVKELGVMVKLHSIIYHAQDEVKALMKGLLDKIPEEREKGKAEVRAIFKSSQLGLIAGCQVLDGTITRNCSVRVMREGSSIWSGPIASLKRFKDDVKEVTKGTECGIVLHGFSAYQPLDIFEAFEVVYLEQDL
jgi:translation initiation factor IF-2